jgi:hypothetical protein
MADREIWKQTNANQIFLVSGSDKTLIPPLGLGGESQANVINALIQSGAVDRRPGSGGVNALPATVADRALEAIKLKPLP